MPVSTAPNPRRQAASRKALRARWGPPRAVRLTDLTPVQAALVVALVDLAKAQRAARAEPPPEAA